MPPQTTAPQGEGSGWRFSPLGEGEAGSVLLCWRAGLGEAQLLLPSSSCSKERAGMRSVSSAGVSLRSENFKRRPKVTPGPQTSVSPKDVQEPSIQHFHCYGVYSMHHNSKAITDAFNLKTQHLTSLIIRKMQIKLQ